MTGFKYVPRPGTIHEEAIRAISLSSRYAIDVPNLQTLQQRTVCHSALLTVITIV
jgi:hypothetical protein